MRHCGQELGLHLARTLSRGGRQLVGDIKSNAGDALDFIVGVEEGGNMYIPPTIESVDEKGRRRLVLLQYRMEAIDDVGLTAEDVQYSLAEEVLFTYSQVVEKASFNPRIATFKVQFKQDPWKVEE